LTRNRTQVYRSVTDSLTHSARCTFSYLVFFQNTPKSNPSLPVRADMKQKLFCHLEKQLLNRCTDEEAKRFPLLYDSVWLCMVRYGVVTFIAVMKLEEVFSGTEL